MVPPHTSPCASHAGHARTPDLDALEASGDVALASSMWAVARAHPGVGAWTSHPRERVATAPGGLTDAWHRLTHALELIGRHEDLTRGSVPVYSGRRVTVSLAAIDRVEMTDHPLHPRVVVATLVADRCTLPLLTPRGSDMHAVLAAAAQ